MKRQNCDLWSYIGLSSVTNECHRIARSHSSRQSLLYGGLGLGQMSPAPSFGLGLVTTQKHIKREVCEPFTLITALPADPNYHQQKLRRGTTIFVYFQTQIGLRILSNFVGIFWYFH